MTWCVRGEFSVRGLTDSDVAKCKLRHCALSLLVNCIKQFTSVGNKKTRRICLFVIK